MEIIKITWQDTLPIRHKVLWPNMPENFCRVEGDEIALHFGALKDMQLICVASIYFDGDSARLRKFATLHEFQGQGVGSHLLKYILTSLDDTNASNFWCDARESAVDFYRRFGLDTEGERFFKSEVPYFRMNMDISKRR